MKLKKYAFLLLLPAIIPSLFAQRVDFDTDYIPYSRYGSYMCFTPLKNDVFPTKAIYLCDVSGNRLWGWNGIFRFETIENGKVVEPQIITDAHLLTLKTPNGKLEITYQDTNTVRIKGTNIGLKIYQTLQEDNSYQIPLPNDQWRFKMGSNCEYAFSKVAGIVSVSGSRWGVRSFENRDRRPLIVIDIQPVNGSFEIVFEQYNSGWKPRIYNNFSFEQCVQNTKSDFDNFLNKMPQGVAEFESTRRLAAYTNWSSVVAPKVNMKRHAMFMSKRVMRSVWSWDHCFNALASYQLPQFAWENYVTPFDYQHPQGALPDIMNDNNCTWGFLKPPVHGLLLRKLMQKSTVSDKQLEEIYPKLVKWTNYWFTYMDDDANGFCQYNHGNDSGWDNATVFDLGFSVESPDLSAFLVLQMEMLSQIAEKLGKNDEAATWRFRSEKLTKDMLSYFWNGNKFVFKRTFDGAVNEKNQSLLPYIPLVLGKRLPEKVRTKMISDLKNNGLFTAHGLASESPKSSLYENDGYWRGPIWAPTTYLMVEALIECGETAFAKDLAKRYCEMCKKSGFAENFNATTGAPLKDSGYTWTASVFLLMNEYLK